MHSKIPIRANWTLYFIHNMVELELPWSQGNLKHFRIVQALFIHANAFNVTFKFTFNDYSPQRSPGFGLIIEIFVYVEQFARLRVKFRKFSLTASKINFGDYYMAVLNFVLLNSWSGVQNFCGILVVQFEISWKHVISQHVANFILNLFYRCVDREDQFEGFFCVWNLHSYANIVIDNFFH